MKKALGWCVARLGEPSSWGGIGVSATAVALFATTVASSLQGRAGLSAAIAAGLIAVVKAENSGS
jgi:hypothetical protein